MKLSDWLKKKLAVHVFQPLLNYHRPWLPRRRLSGCRGWRIEDDGRRVIITFQNGSLSVIAPAAGTLAVIVSFTRPGRASAANAEYISFSVLDGPGLPLTVRENHTGLRAGAGPGQPLLHLNTARGLIRMELDGTVLWGESLPAAAGHWAVMTVRSPRPVRWLGFGQKTGGLFKNGRFYRMWNTDFSDMEKHSDPLYQSCPYALALEDDGRAWGLFFDNPHYSDLKMSRLNRKGALRWRARRGPLALYLTAGPTLREAARQFSVLTGRYRLPPLWALGHHHSRWEPNESAARLTGIAREFRRRRIPLDALHIDIGYMRGFRCFTWDSTRFPDPESFLDSLRGLDIQPVVITDPGLKKDASWEVYATGERHGHFLKDRTGRTFHAPVWPGPAAFPDFARAAAAEWWGGLFAAHTGRGIAGFWIDMNEPSTFTPRRTLPDRLLHRVTTAAGEVVRDHASLHNYYGFLMARATAAGLDRLRPGERSFLFTRSLFAGGQRYASSWTGDNKSTWNHLRLVLPMVMNLGLSGQIMTGPDLGGFWGAPSRELFIRFLQAGTLLPFHRNHTAAGMPPQEIWEFGEEAERICAGHIRLRYALLPYVYTALRQGTVSGDPLCRPLCYEFPGDHGCLAPETADTQYLCGEQLMAAPVLRPGRRDRPVYFPPATEWVCWWTHQVYAGGRNETVAAPLERLPLFAAKGAVIPTLVAGPDGFVSTAAFFDQTLSFDVYPAAILRGALYLDDGHSLDYREGRYSLLAVSGKSTDEHLSLRIERAEGRLDPPWGRFSRVQARIAGYGRRVRAVRVAVNSHELPREQASTEDDWTIIRLADIALPIDLLVEFETGPAAE
jgi:alpha-glucosidase